MHVALASVELFTQRRRTRLMSRQYFFALFVRDLLLPTQQVLLLIISGLVEGHSFLLRCAVARPLCVLLDPHLFLAVVVLIHGVSVGEGH